jgi:hypothetical protein
VVPLVLLLTLFSGVCGAEAPLSYQATFLLRVLAYDRNLKNRTANAATVLLAYRDGDPASEAAKNELVAELSRLAKDRRIVDLPIRVSTISYLNPDDLEIAIDRTRASALYISPGLESALGAMLPVTRRRSVLSFTGVEAWVGKGVSIGLAARGTKPVIVVNLTSSRAEGADLDSALLRTAEIIR